MQVEIDPGSNQQRYRAIGIKLSGYAAYREQWQFSTLGCWDFLGRSKPKLIVQDRLRNICRQILYLFNGEE